MAIRPLGQIVVTSRNGYLPARANSHSVFVTLQHKTMDGHKYGASDNSDLTNFHKIFINFHWRNRAEQWYSNECPNSVVSWSRAADFINCSKFKLFPKMWNDSVFIKIIISKENKWNYSKPFFSSILYSFIAIHFNKKFSYTFKNVLHLHNYLNRKKILSLGMIVSKHQELPLIVLEKKMENSKKWRNYKYIIEIQEQRQLLKFTFHPNIILSFKLTQTLNIVASLWNLWATLKIKAQWIMRHLSLF